MSTATKNKLTIAEAHEILKIPVRVIQRIVLANNIGERFQPLGAPKEIWLLKQSDLAKIVAARKRRGRPAKDAQ